MTLATIKSIYRISVLYLSCLLVASIHISFLHYVPSCLELYRRILLLFPEEGSEDIQLVHGSLALITTV